MTHSTVTHAEALHKCAVCQDTGKKEGSDYLDCWAPGCEAVDKRLALNGFTRSLGVMLDAEDRAWAIFQYAQKQFAAEAVLRDGEKQEPVGYFVTMSHADTGTIFNRSRIMEKQYADACAKQWKSDGHGYKIEVKTAYTHPAPSLQEVGAVPEELLKNPQLLRIAQRMDEANRADDFGKRAREAFEELCEWIASYAAPQPAAAPSGDVERDAALNEAVAALYFNDNSKYEGALWNIVHQLSPSIHQLLQSDPRAAYVATKE